MTDLQYRSDYAQTPQGLSQLADLIGDVFGVDIAPLDRLGHDPSIVAFGYWADGRLIGNVSLFQRHLYLAGQRVLAFGVQSVAVRPEWRGRGLFRDLMGQALRYADQRAERVILVTESPGLYRPFGFRHLTETVFAASWIPRRARPAGRHLSLDTDADVALLHDLFARRAPTSLLASACDHPALFMLKAALTPAIRLVHLPDLDAVVAIRTDDPGTLKLLDILAPDIPTLDDIAAQLGFDGHRVEVHLTPDRLRWQPETQQSVDWGHMVRGPFAPEDRAFMLTSMHI